MRGSLGRFNGCKHAFSTISGAGGGGRGRGRGSSGPSKSPFAARTPGKPDTDEANDEADDAVFPSGVGRGRGKPIPETPIAPSLSSSWISPVTPSAGRGQSTQRTDSRPQEPQGFQPKKPFFFSREDSSALTPKTPLGDLGRKPEESNLPSSLLSVLSGAGRGKPVKPSIPDARASEENRHLRSRPVRRDGDTVDRNRDRDGNRDRGSPSSPRLSREEAVKKAVGILSRADGGRTEEGGRGRGDRGRRGRGRDGRGSRGGGRWQRNRRDSEDDYATGLFLGDNADGEKLAKRVGVENMNKLVEGYEEMSGRILPSPMDDAYLDALHTNNLIEYEPEYLMEEFGTNPDIDEKPPIPLRDALEKMKPFLMAYEGIQSQEEWEEIIKETMEKVPVMKELIDMYSGPDRVTAKQQQQELERVAKTLPDSAPSSVKQFTNRAVLSLQSNPGWGFDKKCQFMDKLVWEVSQHYK
ncbi:hypothetical protein HHK36_023600 [Tetracentron sinense]|uniref:Uncharacterized protein n=1 Tax=Tetracentron sinense TaxID=13715 RepID=A0A834YRH1_TETSI|nr:hypothetical protein HHK36_023600 [Tetracentron sinense]